MASKKEKVERPQTDNDKVSPHGEPVGNQKKAKGSQTTQPWDQDVERRGGHYTGAGETGRKTPGKRQ